VTELIKILTNTAALDTKDEAMIEGIKLKMTCQNAVSILKTTLHALLSTSEPVVDGFGGIPRNHPHAVAKDMRDQFLSFILDHYEDIKPFLESCEDIHVLRFVIKHLGPPGGGQPYRMHRARRVMRRV
jgi:hypothetical protein